MPDAPAPYAGRYVATVTSFRGRRFRVYLEPEDDVSPPGYRFFLPGGCDEIGRAVVKLWPLDIIVPVREALAGGRDVDMTRWKRDQRAKRRAARADRAAGRIVGDDEDAEALARELGLLD